MYISIMEKLQAFKFKLKPNGKQQKDLNRIVGSCRFVWNYFLRLQIQNRKEGGSYFSYNDMSKRLTELKQEHKWLFQTPSQVLQQTLKDLDQAFQRFFKGLAKYPKFRKKGDSGGFRFPSNVKLDRNFLYVPKLGRIHYWNLRSIKGVIRSATVGQLNGEWFVSILTLQEVDEPKHTKTASVGIDVGVAKFATLSDGTDIESINPYRSNKAKLAKYQRTMARKVKFSRNWQKAKRKVQKMHTRIANVRKNFLHGESKKITDNNVVIFIEDLAVSNMVKSAAGTTDKPGNNASAKSGLNRAISDQGWSEFRRQLEYKANWKGGLVVAVPPHHTSQECPKCHHTNKENRKTQAVFACVECGYTANADFVGSVNVLERGRRLLACGEMAHIGRSVKQEPIEASLALCA